MGIFDLGKKPRKPRDLGLSSYMEKQVKAEKERKEHAEKLARLHRERKEELSELKEKTAIYKQKTRMKRAKKLARGKHTYIRGRSKKPSLFGFKFGSRY